MLRQLQECPECLTFTRSTRCDACEHFQGGPVSCATGCPPLGRRQRKHDQQLASNPGICPQSLAFRRSDWPQDLLIRHFRKSLHENGLPVGVAEGDLPVGVLTMCTGLILSAAIRN
jgi:hypothetical protein